MSVITGYFVGVPLRCLTIIALVIYKPNVYALMATQVLDGIGAGIFGLSLPIYTKHLTAGKFQRFVFTSNIPFHILST